MAGHLRDDIFDYMCQLNHFTNLEDERRYNVLDMGVNALRLVALLTCLSHV